jgi:hypothetical protein
MAATNVQAFPGDVVIPGKQYAIELEADLAEADKSATTWYRLLKGGTRNGINGYSTQCELLVNATGLQECVTFDFNFMYQLGDTRGGALNVYRHDSFLERVGVVKFRLTQYGSSPSTADFYLDMKINHDVVAVDRTWTVNLKVVQGGSVIEAPTTFLEKITNYTGIDAHIEYDIGLAAFAVVPSSNAAPFTIMSTGNVGIGTTNPVGVNGGQRLEGSSSTGFEYIATRDDTAAVADDFVGAYLFKNTDTDGVEPHYAGMSSKMTGGNGPMDLRFHTNRDQYESDTPQMIINSAGYVGIGTNAPGLPLETYTGNGANYGLRLRRGAGAAFTDLGHLSTPGTEGLAFSVSDGVSTTQEVMRVTGTGRVGIGTNAPGSLLHIYGDSSNSFEFNPTATNDTAIVDRTGFGATSFYKKMTMQTQNRRWYWGTVNDDSAYLGLACDGGGGDDPDTVAIFNYTGDLYVNNLFAKTNGIFDGKVGIGTNAPLSLFNTYGGSLWNGSDHESVVCATLSVVRGTGNGVEKADAGTGAILKFTHGGTDYRHVTMESVSEANLSAEVGIRFKTVEASSGPVERMRISAHGNVGIGNAAPATLLHLQTKTGDPLEINSDGIGAHNLTEYLRFTGGGDGGDVNSVSVGFKVGADDNSVVSPDGRLDICLNDGAHGNNDYGGIPDTTIATFLGSGNVGIGTVTPRGKLDIYTGATTTAGLILDRYATGTYRTELYQGANGLDIKVGHGSVEPTSVVDVERFSATSARLRIASPGCLRNDGGIEVASYTDITDCKQIWDTGSRFRIFTNGDSKLLFSSAGGSGTLAATTALSFNGADHVGINTATPDTNYALTVEGTIKCGSLTSTGGGIYLHLMYFTGFGEGANKVNLFRSTEDDDVVYYRFRNQQSIHQTEIGGYIQGYLQEYSDDRLKVNERYLTDGLDVIKRLKPQVYDKRPDLVENLERDGHNVESIERKEVGFIAQDLYYEVPELKHIVDVGGGVIPAEHITIGDDPTVDPDYSSWGNVAAGVRYTEIIPYNTAAIQDLSNLRDLDVDRITVLESQVSNLLVRVQTLESGTP